MNRILYLTKEVLLRSTKFETNSIQRLLFHEDFASKEPKQTKENLSLGAVSSKYDIFRETDSPIILDIDEERSRIGETIQKKKVKNVYENINLERGRSGVFEIQDLVDLLKKENADNIFVCTVPKDIKYVEYMCIVSGRSRRHMNAMAEFVRKVYKMKRNSEDILPKIEGENASDWIALDMGNIALHIFSIEARQTYDLESLWSVGPEFDRECNKPDQPLVQMYERHSIYLGDLKPKVIK